ncbi:MAG: hypothetical protein A3K19_10705 [Lentisphaerae bacterium RIFOXYB12_FULL_65_16]|nr:MAG: hypothetical protein A3K18_29855 [Lentisphaerae bacterium RIFOXYA12_64_32]OGV87921.1 MAG: hypothetical protein A3K19_10705 [Lentisphaerae bacterium RIFOXYB12_FULL_65_16]
MTGAEELRCPVCRAPFRGTGDCSRCGADLRRLMRLVVRARAARQAARRALVAGHPSRALGLVRLAQNCHPTPAGTRLASLSALVPHSEGTVGNTGPDRRPKSSSPTRGSVFGA